MFKKLIIRLVLISFFIVSVGPLPDVSAQTIIDLPAPGMMVSKSGPYQPLQLKGILVNIKNPLRFDFLVDKGDSHFYGQPLKDGITRLAKYFLTCLTVPENDLWVNLSPYEKDRIVPGNFGITLMGRDLLEQDYLLKQMMASLSYPENDLGKRFWQRVYRKSYELYGTTDVPINTFNKVWIIPKSAQVYAQGNGAFVVNSQLDVMLEADYLAIAKNQHQATQVENLTQSVIRQIILPELRREVNEGKNFAVVRQVYNAMILATWYKRHLKDSLLGRMYVGRNEVSGVDIADKHAKEKIFQQYLKAYKKCVYNYIKEDYDPITQQTVPRKYASGGMNFTRLYFSGPDSVYIEKANPKGMDIGTDLAMATVDVTATNSNGKMESFTDMREIPITHPFHQVPFELRRQDAAMISPKIGAWARATLMSFAFLSAFFVAAPSFAAHITLNPDGMTLQVKVDNKYDTFGQVLLKAGYAYNENFWKKDGTVAKAVKFVSNIHSDYKIRLGDTFNIPTKAEFNRMVSSAVASGVPSSAPPVAATVQPISPAVTTAPISSAPPPPPQDTDLETSQYVNAMLQWSIPIAILGLGILPGGIGVLKDKKLRKLRRQATVDLRKSRPLPNVTQASGQGWGFNVVSYAGPALPSADEIAWAHQQQTVQPPVGQQVNSTVNQPAKTNSLKVMDYLSLTMATGLAAFSLYSGGDLRDMLTAFLSSFLATRLIYAAELWAHEIGHTLFALIQSPKDYKKILTRRNFFGNYSIADWLRVFIPSLKSSQNAGVDLPLTGKARRLNQTAGFAISVVSSLGLWFSSNTGLFLPLGPMSLASLFLLYNSWTTDIRDPSSKGRIECGNGGFIWLPKVFKQGNDSIEEGFFPKSLQEGLENMKAISELRGDQGKGIFTWGETSDGDVVPIIFKTMKSKRGPPVIKVAQLGFNGKLKKISRQNIRPLSGAVREDVSHDRFLTQGTPSQEGLQPQLGPEEKRELCYFSDGQYQRKMRTIVVALTLNGDNDFYFKFGKKMPTSKMGEFFPIKFHMEKTVYISSNEEKYYDYLPTGDTPPLALEVQWHDNQGDWWAASRFAIDEIFYHSSEESMEHNLSPEQEDAIGNFFMKIYEQHEQLLIRPKLHKKDKTLADSWVTEEMVKKYPELSFQLNALEDFAEDLKKNILASDTVQILNRLQRLHPQEDFEDKLERFISMTMERFFTADIFEAVKEVNERAEGTYGVRALSSKYPEKGIFWTRGQSIALGINKQAGYMAYNSEHTALMTKMGDAEPVQEILVLNSTGGGQITETYFDHQDQELAIKAYSPEKARFLTEDELKEWRMELGPDNKYFTPLVERDPENIADEDIADIPRAIWDTEEKWKDPGSFVRQSADDLFNKMASRYVERYIKDSSRFYKVAQGNLLYFIDQQLSLCQGSQCSEETFQARRASLLRAVQHDPRILTYLKSRLDILVAHQADHLSEQIIEGKVNEDDLLLQLNFIDEQLSGLMDREIRILTENLNAGVLTPRIEGKNIPLKESVGSGEADFFAAGLEDSLWIGSENLKAMLQAFFPQMVIETDSSNKALDLKPNDHHKLGRRTIVLIVSKSGATSPTKNLVPILNSITPGNIFAMTGRVDTLIGLSLGQRYYKGAPFGRRIFPTGNYYPSEVNSVSEVELLANQIEMVLYLVKRMKEIFPHQRPWGMDVSDDNVQKLEKWRDNVLKKAKHMTGMDEEGNQVSGYRENKEILHDGQILGKMITETPLVNLSHRAFVFCVFYFGAPLATAAALLESMTGLPIYSSGLGHLISAALDATLALTLPWWITTGFYRIFSGRVQRWARLGPPKVTIGDNFALHQVIEESASKRGAMAIASMDVEYHGGNPRDHYGVRFLHRLRRGSIEIFGLPEDPHTLSGIKMTDSQSNVRTDMSIGNVIWDKMFGKRFLAGPEIFTIGHGEFDPNLTQHHMNIGPLETVFVDKEGNRQLRPDVTETMGHFYAQSFETLDRLIAYNVFFNEAYRWATKWGRWRIWRPWESISRTGVHSTPSPISGPKKQLPEYHDKEYPYFKADTKQVSPVDSAQVVSRDGGINMNSRLMQLNITGEAQNSVGDVDNTSSRVLIKGVVPQVSGIVTVTPDMLKAMLGEGYLN